MESNTIMICVFTIVMTHNVFLIDKETELHKIIKKTAVLDTLHNKKLEKMTIKISVLKTR